MSQLPELTVGAYVVVTAWQCHTCDVAGRSLDEAEVSCWNCGGAVTITARPAIRTEEL
jgi:hypothetical protein